jgi:hypothetical protein
METQNYNLAEKEFSKETKIILWCVVGLFFLTGVFILFRTLVLHNKDVTIKLAFVPFGISLIVSVIAVLATIKRENLFFTVSDEKIEFRFGILNAHHYSFLWTDIKELIIPSRQKKVMVKFKDGKNFVINLTWIEKKKSFNIIKGIYRVARERNLEVIKVNYLVRERIAK